MPKSNIFYHLKYQGLELFHFNSNDSFSRPVYREPYQYNPDRFLHAVDVIFLKNKLFTASLKESAFTSSEDKTLCYQIWINQNDSYNLNENAINSISDLKLHTLQLNFQAIYKATINKMGSCQLSSNLDSIKLNIPVNSKLLQQVKMKCLQ